MLYIRATVRLKLFTARVPTKSLVQPHRRFVARCRMPNLTARCTSPGGPADRPPPSPAKRPKVGAGSPGDGRPVPRAATCARGGGGTRGRGGRGGGAREQAHQIQTVPPPPREPGPSPPPKPPRPGGGSSRTARALGFLFPKKVVTAARGPESRGPAPRAASPPSALHVPPGRGGERRREAAAA